MIHLYAYLKKNPRSKTVFDPTPMDHEPHSGHDWSGFYKPQEELIPGEMPEPEARLSRPAALLIQIVQVM